MQTSDIRLDTQRLGHSILPTLLILVIGSVIAAIIGTIALTAATVIGYAGVGLGPMFFVLLPIFLSQATLTLMIAVVVTPLWALLCGFFFAGMTAGRGGSMTRRMGVKLLADDHKIVQYVQEQARRLDLPPVAHVGYYDSDDINAFAAGVSKDNAMIAFSTGLLQKMTGEQFMAVMCHELAHIANGDMRKMTVARGVQDALTWFLVFNRLKMIARWLFCFVSELEIMRLSRTREFYADAIGAVLMGPEAMIGALECIERDKARPKGMSRWFSNYLFFGARSRLFRTHPPINRRVRALEDGEYIRRLPTLHAVSSPSTQPDAASSSMSCR